MKKLTRIGMVIALVVAAFTATGFGVARYRTVSEAADDIYSATHHMVTQPYGCDYGEFTTDWFITVYKDGKKLDSPTGFAFDIVSQNGPGEVIDAEGKGFCFLKTPAENAEETNVKYRLYYDFNGNGKIDKDEFVYESDFTAPVGEIYKGMYEVCEAAVKQYQTSSYMADLCAIELYVAENYNYPSAGKQCVDGYDCIDGANIARLWCKHKYNSWGEVVHGMDASNTSHTAYFGKTYREVYKDHPDILAEMEEDGYDLDERIRVDIQGRKNKGQLSASHKKYKVQAINYYKSLGI